MIEKITLDKKCKVEEIENKFPDIFSNFSVNRRLNDNQFTEIFTISNNEEIVGLLILDTIYERMELVQIEVIKSERGQGYAKKMLEFMIEEAQKRKLENITLEVRKDNAIALYLYEKYGFKKVAIRKQYYHGIDGILMERKMM